MTVSDVIVVGAGLAGLVCARRLQQAGHQVCVVEKSRGVGGRLATRRIQGVPVDHGARYFTNHRDRLQHLIQQWCDQQLLVPWQPHTYTLQADGTLQAQPSSQPYWVAPAGMTAIAKQLAQGLTIHQQQRGISLAQTASLTWQLTVVLADQSHLQHQARAVVLALPAPQIVPLLTALAALEPLSPLLSALAAVTYAPIMTVMAQYATPTQQTHDPLPCSPTAPWMVAGHPATPLFWVGLDSGKRSPADTNIVIHSSAAFARDWLAVPDWHPAGTALLAQAGNLIAPWLAQPTHWQVHRWRYGLVETPAAEPCLTTSVPLPLAACGDWCGLANLDTALASGWTAAAAIHEALGHNTPLPGFPIGLVESSPSAS